VARLELDPALIEEALFLRARQAEEQGDGRAEEWYREREALYTGLAALERQRAFVELGQRWFERWGLARSLQRALEHVPRLRALARVRVRRALGRRDEGSDLFGAGDETRLEVALAPARFLDPAGLQEFLVRECLYAEDMLAPDFGYRAELGSDLDQQPARAELVRDRLRVLWEARVRGRAAARLGSQPPAAPGPAFRRAFAGLEPGSVARLHERAATGALSTYGELLAAAHGELGAGIDLEGGQAARPARAARGSPAR
jgi:hypothetical protein